MATPRTGRPQRAVPPRLAVALPGLLLVGACSGSPAQPMTGASSPDPCGNPQATAVPASCIPGEGGSLAAIPSQSGAPPVSSAAIPAVTEPPQPAELARGGNDVDASVVTRDFSVTLPAGQRLRTLLACQGAHLIVLTTQPSSAAEQTFACGYTAPAQLAVEDPVPVKVATRYVVTVRAPAPARWYVVVSATNAPLPPS